MIQYIQITKSDEITGLSDYYVFTAKPFMDPAHPVSHCVEIAVLQVSGYLLSRETSMHICLDLDADNKPPFDGYYTFEKAASSIANLLLGSFVVAESEDLQTLQSLLKNDNNEGFIFYLPVAKLVPELFPSIQPGSVAELCTQFHMPAPDPDDSLTQARQAYSLLRRCQIALGVQLPVAEEQENDLPEVTPPNTIKHSPRRISNRTLKRWAREIWSITPGLLTGAAVLIVFLGFLMFPREEDDSVDRNQAPINYLVLSWDQTGKYGIQPKAKNTQDTSIQFRIPYGVYTVLNNNSIPVEITVTTEGQEITPGENTDSDSAAIMSEEFTANIPTSADAVTLKSEVIDSDSGKGEAEEEEAGPVSVTMRPNSSRQITVDTDQYVTLSKDATDLIFFYISEVPEEKESTTTGTSSGSHGVVYAYVNGTEVRFRKAPSLEGQIISSVNTGQQVQVLGVTGEWTHVTVQDQKGYIFSKFLSSEDPNAVSVQIESPSDDKSEDVQTVPDQLSSTQDASAGTGAENEAVADDTAVQNDAAS